MKAASIPSPTFRNEGVLSIVGLKEHYDASGPRLIPAQWQRFNRYFGNIPGQVGAVAYGLLYNLASCGSYDYLAGVEVSTLANVPRELVSITVPAQKYAAFPHETHVSKLSETVDTIARNWRPEWGRARLGDVRMIERYGEHFDPQTASGDVEVWLPIEG